MNEIVFLEPNRLDAEPFTTSKVISERSGVSHKYVKKQITSHVTEFESLGLLGAYATESTGGRPEEFFKLNEPQSSFLLTLLKNTPVVVTFKLELVRQFYLMRTELTRRHLLREQLKPIRRELTDVIKDIPDVSKWAYKQYTDLAYKTAIGKNAAQLRKERGAESNAAAIDYMTAAEIEAVAKQQNRIAVLVDMGMDYQQAKATLMNRMIAGQTA